MVAPIIPGLTDHEVPKILDACAKAGAQFAGYTIIRLPWAVAPLFEHWLEEHFPDRKEKVLRRIRHLAGKPAKQFAVAHAHDRRRNFRRANRVAIQSRLSSRRHRRAADAFVQIISPIDNSIALVWLNTVGATNMTVRQRAVRLHLRYIQQRPMSARLSDYDYVLPRELIAQRPLERREDSRMMVLHRAEQKIEHRQFRELKTFLQPGDLFVLNDTRVLAARRFSDDGAIEFLFLERLGPRRWKCMVTPGPQNARGRDGNDRRCVLCVSRKSRADGERIVTFDKDVDVYAGGSMPLPPYINRPSDETDAARYQTVFAREPVPWLRLRLVCISPPKS